MLSKAFQTLVHLSHAQRFLSDSVYSKAYFHCSGLTATILSILGVDRKRLIIEKTVKAKAIILSWLPRWDPWKSASIWGIISDINSLLQTNLMKSSPDLARGLHEVPYTLNSKNETNKKIVYFSRKRNNQRFVRNQREVLEAIESNLKSGYELVVVGQLQQATEEDMVIGGWRQMVALLRNAAVIIGPHGGRLSPYIYLYNDYVLKNGNICVCVCMFICRQVCDHVPCCFCRLAEQPHICTTQYAHSGVQLTTRCSCLAHIPACFLGCRSRQWAAVLVSASRTCLAPGRSRFLHGCEWNDCASRRPLECVITYWRYKMRSRID